MNQLGWLVSIAINHDVLIYGLIIILAATEGPIISVLGGILLHWGYFPLLPLYFALMFGDLCGDVVWYQLGRHAGRPFAAKFGKYFGVTEEGIGTVEKIFHKYKDAILIVSKLTAGLGFATVVLFTAGMAKISFRRYMTINVLGEFFWIGFLLFVGYSFAQLYITFDNYFARMSLIAIAVVIVVVVWRYGIYLRNRIIRSTT